MMTNTTAVESLAPRRSIRADVTATIGFTAVIVSAAFSDFVSSWLPALVGYPAGAIIRDAIALLFIAFAAFVLVSEGRRPHGRWLSGKWTAFVGSSFAPFAAFAAWVVVLIPLGPAKVPAILAARNLLLYVLVGYAAGVLVRAGRLSPASIIAAVTVVGFVMAGLGILDTVTHGAIVTDLGYRRDYSGVEGSSGILVAGATAAFQGFVRASGGISNALVFGYLMAALSVFATWRLHAIVATSSGWGKGAAVFVALGVATGVACVYSLTRGAMLALVVGLVLLLLMSRHRTILIGAVTTLALAFALTWVGSALLSTSPSGQATDPSNPNPNLIDIVGTRVTSADPLSQESSSLRLDQLRHGIESLVSRPLGTGLGTEGSASTRSNAPGVQQAPDVYALVVALQTGLVGAALFGLVFGALIIGSIRRRLRGRDLIVALTGVFAVSSVLSASPDAPVFASIVWILLLAVSAVPDQEAMDDEPRDRVPSAEPLAGRATT
jgi:hypothetical protein